MREWVMVEGRKEGRRLRVGSQDLMASKRLSPIGPWYDTTVLVIIVSTLDLNPVLLVLFVRYSFLFLVFFAILSSIFSFVRTCSSSNPNSIQNHVIKAWRIVSSGKRQNVSKIP